MGIHRLNRGAGNVGRLNVIEAVKEDYWWLAGGIAPADVAAVWQPKGAASLAASYLRLAGSEGHANIDPAVVGGVSPNWDVTSGWITDGTKRLLTGIRSYEPTKWSVFIRFTDPSTASTSLLFGNAVAPTPWYINSRYVVYRRYAVTNKNVIILGTISSGVVGIAGKQPYLNGVADGVALTSTDITGTYELALMWTNGISGYIGTFAAVVFYKTIITPTQVGLLKTAMNLL